MKYKVIEYNSDVREEQTGTCDLCFDTALVENGSITVEDENGKTTNIELTWWSWGDYFTIYIDNVVDFSAWLQERDVKPIDEANDWSWLDRLVTEYDEEKKMNKQKSGELKKFTIGFSNSQKAEFLVDDFTQDELTKIISQFYNGNLMKIRNFYVNPKSINYFIIDDVEEYNEEQENG